MSNLDVKYLAGMSHILEEGTWQENRTGIDACFVPSVTIQSDLSTGIFPLLSSKKMAYSPCFAEMLGFLKGFNSASQFRDMGCRIWDANANENDQWLASPFRKGEDSLGLIYGATWRSREAFVTVKTKDQKVHYENLGYEKVCERDSDIVMSKVVDQLADILNTIENNPLDRRIIMHAWFPELFPQMALPPCHVLYEFIPDLSNKIMHIAMFQRSTDYLLGHPFNGCGTAFLLSVIAKATGYKPGMVTHSANNCHFYRNQIEAAQIQLARVDQLSDVDSNPILNINMDMSLSTPLERIMNLTMKDISIDGYEHLGPLPKVKMAV